MIEAGLTAQPGDLVLLVSPSNKRFIFRLTPGQELHTHRGIVSHDGLVGISWGAQISSHLGSHFLMVPPGLADIIQELKRNTQIMYPKDIGYLLVMMGIGPGRLVVEAGTGSGALTTAFAWAVGPQGRVATYEQREPMQNLARKNLTLLGYQDRVSFVLRDIAEGFDERGADAVFLDLPNPWDYLLRVRETLKPGGYFGTILPTINQVQTLLYALRQDNFAFVDVCEILLRHYKPVYNRLRPTDRMVAHTGYLTFARPVLPGAAFDTPEPAGGPDDQAGPQAD